MRKYLFVFCLILSISVNAQERKLRFGVQLNPVVTFSNVNNIHPRKLNDYYKPDIFDYSTATVGSLFGLKAKYIINRFGVNSGLFLVNQSYKFTQSRFPREPDYVGVFTERARLSSLQVPLGLLYKFYEADNKNVVYLKAGFAYNYTGYTGGSSFFNITKNGGDSSFGVGASTGTKGFENRWEFYAGASYNAFFKKKNSFDIGLSYHLPFQTAPVFNVIHTVDRTEFGGDISPYLTYVSFDFTIFFQRKPES